MPKYTLCKVCGTKTTSKNNTCCKHSTTRGKYIRTESTNKNMSIATKGKNCWSKGRNRPEHSEFLKEWWNENPSFREEMSRRMSERMNNTTYLQKLSEALSGDKNPNWKGGISKKHYKSFYKKLKDEIRNRDDYMCMLCKISELELGYTLSIHHIDYNKENSIPENLISLCKKCNSLVNFGREEWKNYFGMSLKRLSRIEDRTDLFEEE
mgnify:CR=1 FL=1